MNQKLNSILLIDDDEPTNFLHQLVINKSNCVEDCIVMSSAQEALNYLSIENSPNLILLDINMPAMNGWEFLEAFRELNISKKDEIIIIMLTTSFNPDEEEKSKLFKEVQDFKRKPLTNIMLKEIIEKYFNK
ncbi:MAG: response regulator [Raineya sp.]|jgi:CheY-like chemotaxis protein|nr:response regulator [Raineya sp.]